MKAQGREPLSVMRLALRALKPRVAEAKAAYALDMLMARSCSKVATGMPNGSFSGGIVSAAAAIKVISFDQRISLQMSF